MEGEGALQLPRQLRWVDPGRRCGVRPERQSLRGYFSGWRVFLHFDLRVWHGLPIATGEILDPRQTPPVQRSRPWRWERAGRWVADRCLWQSLRHDAVW